MLKLIKNVDFNNIFLLVNVKYRTKRSKKCVIYFDQI